MNISLQSAAHAPAEPENPELKKVSEQYEALFLHQLVTAMRKTVTKGSLVPESHGERVYQGMLDFEYSQKMAESGQIGLSNVIYDQMNRALKPPRP